MKYELKEHYKINEYSKGFLLPSYYEKNVHQLTAIAEYLHKHLKDVRSIDFNDVGGGFIELSLSHEKIPNYYITSYKLDFNLNSVDSLLKLIREEWDGLNTELFKKFTEDGEKYGWD